VVAPVTHIASGNEQLRRYAARLAAEAQDLAGEEKAQRYARASEIGELVRAVDDPVACVTAYLGVDWTRDQRADVLTPLIEVLRRWDTAVAEAFAYFHTDPATGELS
jgi:hypothetical protein